MSAPRVIFVGMECPFSRPALAALLAAGCDLRAIVVPRRPGHASAPGPALPPGRALPVLTHSGALPLLAQARQHGVPVLPAGRKWDPHLLTTLAQQQPDLLCVACYPWLLPPAALALPRWSALNIHPSLLPAHRGPQPLFWTFHAGLEGAGVTLHQMDQGADTGPIVAQTALPLPDGLTYSQAETRLAQQGARLLTQAITTLDHRPPATTPQPAHGASWAPQPTGDDFVVTTAWTARRAYNFIRGVAGWGQPISLPLSDGTVLPVGEAIGYNEADEQAEEITHTGHLVRVRCATGTLTLRLAP